MAWKLVWTEDDAGVADGLATLDGLVRVVADGLVVSGIQVVGAQQPPVPDPMGGGIQDAECRMSVQMILDALRAHGLIEP